MTPFSAVPSEPPQRFIRPVTGDVLPDPGVAADGRPYAPPPSATPCGAPVPALQRPASHGLARPAASPEPPSLPALGAAVATVAVPMNTQTGCLWTAKGVNEDAAMCALDALVQIGRVGREQMLSHIATAATCASVRIEATHRLGNVPSVAAVDALRALTAAADVGVAQAATLQLSTDTAHMLDQEATCPPTDVNRCLRDLICHVQDRDAQASSTLLVLTLRAEAHPADVAEHLTVVAATCRARIAWEAWETLEALCRKDASLHEPWLRNLLVLQRAAHPDVARAAQDHTA